MLATQVLREEHEGILAMLAVVEAAAFRLRDGKPIPKDLMLNAADFFSNFADKCHHGKEEDRLFPKMGKYGIPEEDGPIGVMKAEHAQGRVLIRAMREDAARYADDDTKAVPALVRNTLEYVELLREHIGKENQVLFMMADQVIPEVEQQALARDYAEFEANVMGAGVHERYHAMIAEYQKLAATWN